MKKVQAHETHSNAGIEAVMHIDPGHHPIIGKEAKFFFTFKDVSGAFDINKCDCNIILSKDGNQIDRQPFAATNGQLSADGTNPLYTKVFTDPGDYKIEVSGNPKDGATFKPFVLNYDVSTVADESAVMNEVQHQEMDKGHAQHSAWHVEHLGHIIIFGGGLVVALALLARDYFQTRKLKRSKQEN